MRNSARHTHQECQDLQRPSEIKNCKDLKRKTHSKNNQDALDLSLANRKLSRNGVLGNDDKGSGQIVGHSEVILRSMRRLPSPVAASRSAVQIGRSGVWGGSRGCDRTLSRDQACRKISLSTHSTPLSDRCNRPERLIAALVCLRGRAPLSDLPLPSVKARGYPLCPQLRDRGSLYLMSENFCNQT